MIQDIPENLAYPLGGSPSEMKYFYLQVHYDNPSQLLSKIKFSIFIGPKIIYMYIFFSFKDVKDTSGIRLYVTKKYRPTEFGVLTVMR